MSKLEELAVRPLNTVREVMARIDKSGKGIALVVDERGLLLGTVTDGDVRRAMLAGLSSDESVETLLERKAPEPYLTPVTAPVGTPAAELLHTMDRLSIRHIPLLDEARRVVDVALLNELAMDRDLPLRAVVMAGGYGARLRPLTDDLPKPMLPVGDRPLLELVIERLQFAGIRRLNLTTHYKAELISEHFGDGHDFGVDIQYVQEGRPLGTAGALRLVDVENEPLLVINGDILTRMDFRAMHDFHRKQRADMTVAVRRHEVAVPYGVIQSDGVEVRGIVEKPVLRHLINAGIYLLSPGVSDHIPDGRPCDMPELISILIERGRRVVSYPVQEYWLDIGRPGDYQQAQDDVQTGNIPE